MTEIFIEILNALQHSPHRITFISVTIKYVTITYEEKTLCYMIKKTLCTKTLLKAKSLNLFYEYLE